VRRRAARGRRSRPLGAPGRGGDASRRATARRRRARWAAPRRGAEASATRVVSQPPAATGNLPAALPRHGARGLSAPRARAASSTGSSSAPGSRRSPAGRGLVGRVPKAQVRRRDPASARRRWPRRRSIRRRTVPASRGGGGATGSAAIGAEYWHIGETTTRFAERQAAEGQRGENRALTAGRTLPRPRDRRSPQIRDRRAVDAAWRAGPDSTGVEHFNGLSPRASSSSSVAACRAHAGSS